MPVYKPERIEQLEDLGWSRGDAKIYCLLVRLGEKPATSLKNHLEMNKTKLYGHLKSLEEDSRIEVTQNSPRRRYKAINPESLFTNELETFESDTEEIKDELARTWEVEGESSKNDEIASIIKNEEGFDLRLLELIKKAENKVIAFDKRKVVLSESILDSINNLANDVNIELLVRKEVNDGYLKRLDSDSIEVREIEVSDFLSLSTFYVIDSKLILLNLGSGAITIKLEDAHLGKILESEAEELKESSIEVDLDES